MSLEQKVKDRPKLVIQKTPPARVLDEIRKGKKFVIVDDSFNQSFIPLGYMLIDMMYEDESFKTLVPQNLLYFLANPGEGDVDDALDEIADFYKEVEDFEDENLEENVTSVQGTNWAVTARDAYQTYLINKLTKPNKEDHDVPEWDEAVLKELNLDDEYIIRRVKAVAALCLGKTSEADLKKYDLDEVVRHVTINERKVEQLSREEFDQITCWAGSHYNIREEYRNKPDVEYRIDRVHDAGHKVGEKISHKREALVLDSRIDKLEKEIDDYRVKKNGSIGRHDRMLLRTYVNLNYVAKENAQKQLEVKPDTLTSFKNGRGDG